MKSLAVLFAGTVLAVGANAATVSFNFSNALSPMEIAQSGNRAYPVSSQGHYRW